MIPANKSWGHSGLMLPNSA